METPLKAIPKAGNKMIHIWPMLFGEGKLCIGYGHNPQTYIDEWFYENPQDAIKAAEKWNGVGEPPGWIRHHPTRRIRPGGNPDKEHVNHRQ